MKVSIIIRAYNAEATIARAIKSALAQDFATEDYEIIIVDDGSMDGTKAIIQEYTHDPRVRLIAQENSGAIAAGNAGARVATGEYLAFLDSDDYYEPAFLGELSAVLDDDPTVDFVYADYIEEFEDKKKIVHLDDLFGTIVDNSMYRRTSFLAAGGWRDGVSFAEYDLLLRTLHQWKHTHIAKPLSTYFRRRESLTGKSEWVIKALDQLKQLHPGKEAEINRIRSYALT